jgi:(E)-4-hydroxy-3-methylbut-2-enyl-diphosphate synthase
MIKRHQTRSVRVGPLQIGGQAPIVIQSMNNTDTRDVAATLEQIRQLHEAGCDLTRLAVPDMQAAEAFGVIRARSPLPIVADIHFDYRLALAAIEAGADKIRINPGNIGGPDRLRQVISLAKARRIPIRVGVNAGSLSQDVIDRHGGVCAAALVDSALEAAGLLEKWDFHDVVLSIKASEPVLNLEACRMLAARTDIPLHIGVTEAGTLREGVVRSAVGIGALLAEGIGDTLRVSLTADPVEEVRTAWSILRALDLRQRGPRLISCPTCGRTRVDVLRVRLYDSIESDLAELQKQAASPTRKPGDIEQLMLEREVRDRLLQMDDARRIEVLQSAIESGDSLTVESILSAPKIVPLVPDEIAAEARQRWYARQNQIGRAHV